MIKNLTVFVTLNPNTPNLNTQILSLPEVVNSILKTKSLVNNITTKNIGGMKTSGNITQIVKLQVTINPEGNDPNVNRLRGCRVGMSATDPGFLTAVIGRLTILFGVSAVLDISTTIDSPLKSLPPGLAPDGCIDESDLALILTDGVDSHGSYISGVSTGVLIPAGSVASVKFDCSSLFLTAPDINIGSIYLYPAGRVSPFIDALTLKSTIVIGSDTYILSSKPLTKVLSIKKNGTEIGQMNFDNVSSLPFLSASGSSLSFVNDASLFILESNVSGDYSVADYLYLLSTGLPTPTLITSIEGSISFTNNTGADIPAYTNIAQLLVLFSNLNVH